MLEAKPGITIRHRLPEMQHQSELTVLFCAQVGAEGGWELPQLRRLAYNYVQLESAFDQLVPRSRRSNSNHYCRSNLHAATAGFSRDKGAALGLIKSASSIGSLRELMCAPADSRYMKMNLSHDGSRQVRRPAGSCKRSY